MSRPAAAEQRRHPRHARRLEVDLAGARLFTTNVALGGMQVEIPALRHAGLRAVIGGQAPEWRIVLPGQVLPLIVTGEIRYADPVDDAYLAGVAFRHWHAYGEERWRSYIESLASP
ncbi:MAG: PilZ domain-containing protein [Gammaproteobacteria bacterium]